MLAVYYLGTFKAIEFYFEIENFLTCLQILFCFMILMASIHLLSWHFYFWRKGITTFTHIQFLKAKAEKKKEMDEGLLTREKYDEWLVEFEQNLERFKYQSKIKKLVIFKKTNAVRNEEEISAPSK